MLREYKTVTEVVGPLMVVEGPTTSVTVLYSLSI